MVWREGVAMSELILPDILLFAANRRVISEAAMLLQELQQRVVELR